jgi:hypothetical protein
MDAETAREEFLAGAESAERRGGAPPEGGLTPEAGVDEALLRRLDRIVVLAARRREPAPHGELLDELRGLMRAAEQLRSVDPETTEEVVERPARRLHGT